MIAQDTNTFSKSPPPKLTPMMAQYLQIKASHQDCLLFFRMGDFYELFLQDAVVAAEVLDITLTKRGKQEDQDIQMCGVPHHSSEHYIAKLITAGYKVAICEQLETPEEAKKRGGSKIVRREVVRIITSGTILEESILDARQSNFLLSIATHEGILSLAFLDITTGVFYVLNSNTSAIASDVKRFNTKEIIISEKLYQDPKICEQLAEWKRFVSVRANVIFDVKRAEDRIKGFFKLNSLHVIDAFKSADVSACGALLEYLEHTNKNSQPFVSLPKKIKAQNFLSVDLATKKNLELETSLSGNKKYSLFGVIDKTLTASGARLMNMYINSPLANSLPINKRLDVVEFFYKQKPVVEDIRIVLKTLPDVERSLSKVFTGRALPRDLGNIRNGLRCAQIISENIMFSNAEKPELLKSNLAQISGFDAALNILSAAIIEENPLSIPEQGFVKAGYSKELDELYYLKEHVHVKVNALRDKYRAVTGVNNLKISYNNVMRYFVEVTPSQAAKVPDDIFLLKQTLGTSLRYTTPELKQLEEEILSAEEKIMILEKEIFKNISAALISVAEHISNTASILAFCDVMISLAVIAQELNFTRPKVDASGAFEIGGGFHPMVFKTLQEKFITNDCKLGEGQCLWLITGPNMAGKSTFLRQNALIVILAQMGSFVPAQFAHIGVVDKLFSRIGSGDDISHGQSTFMVEMAETSYILNNATSKSFIILDEIGRGTATYDGLSIAWAVLENIHNDIGARTLFATHYHELTDLEQQLPKLACHTVGVKEWNGEIVFLHKLEKGRANRSYGIHVAQLSGMPKSVITRAEQVLTTIESTHNNDNFNVPATAPVLENHDYKEIINIINAIDIDNLTPREAFDQIYKLKQKVE